MFERLKKWLDSDAALSWTDPIPFARVEISMRNMCGQNCFWLTSWYNINLLSFKIGGTLRILGKRQEFYDMCVEHNKNRKEGD